MTSPAVSANSARPLRTIRQTLVRIVLACVLPAWLGIAVLIFGMYKVLGERTPEGALMTAHALVLAVDRELAIARTALEALTASEVLAAGDFKAFRERALRVSRLYSFSNIVVTRRNGQQVVNTMLPANAELPLHATVAADDMVFETRKPAVSDLFHGRAARAQLVSVKVPVIYGGEVRYVLSAGIAPDRLNTLLADQNLPAEWTASIFDASHTVVGRSRTPERYIGQSAPAGLTHAMARKKSGIVTVRTLDGRPVYAAFSRSELSNWSVAIGVPTALVTDRLYEFLSLGAAGAFAVLAAGIGLAVHHAKTIAAGVRSLARDAGEPPGSDRPAVPPSDIREIDEAARRIETAAIALQRRTHERDLAERDKDIAQKTAQLKDEFIATVSHELRTPLTAITASLALIEDDHSPTVDAQTQALIDIAHANSQRLHRLVNDILDIEKLESGKAVFHLDRVAIQPLLEQAIASDRALAAGQGVALRVGCAKASDVCVDKDRLTQVVANFMSNAIKFSPPGSVIVLSASDRDGGVRISVRDHGPGIPESFRARVFEKFAQADTSDARARSGTGLGLSIVKEIVRQMGGDVGFADAPGGGTVFFADLPYWDVAAADERPGDGAPLAPATALVA